MTDVATGAQAGIERGSAVDQVIDRIRALMRDRALSVGDVLPSELELAAMFGSSRNTVREAIRTLRAYGIVESRQKVGAVITDRREAAVMDVFSFAIDISAETFRDVQGFRRLIEMNLGDRIVGHIPPATIDALETINAAMANARDATEASQLDYDFHKTIIDAAGNRTLSETYLMLKPVIRKVMETGKAQRRALDTTAATHALIIQALRDGDRLAYAFHTSRHLDAGLEFLPAARGDQDRKARGEPLRPGETEGPRAEDATVAKRGGA